MNSQAIELKGIVRNQTKIGVQDGQCDDIVNLRFKDGSWRVADDGKVVYQMPSDTTYSQLYVHTNVYHHLLGVSNNKLYWFANIEADGETFANLDSPVEICNVQGDVTIVQNGHLITIISLVPSDTTPLPLADSSKSEERISYAIFVTGTNEYKVLNVNANGEQTDRGLYPFGKVHLNLDSSYSKEMDFFDVNTESGEIWTTYKVGGITIKDDDYGVIVAPKQKDKDASTLLWFASMEKAYGKAKDANAFTDPFLAVIAVKLYDGSYIYSSTPVLLSPREVLNFNHAYFSEDGKYIVIENNKRIYHYKGNYPVPYDYEGNTFFRKGEFPAICNTEVENEYIRVSELPVFSSGASQFVEHDAGESGVPISYMSHLESHVYGSELLLTLGNIDNLTNNSDVFTGVSIFITKESKIFNLSGKYEDSLFYLYNKYTNAGSDGESYLNISYRPKIRTSEEIIYDLTHSPFYLLREYNINELKLMKNTTTKVDLSDVKYKGLLNNLVQQEMLSAEAFGRSEYIPKIAYSYNQKLHIANYKSGLFHGYPIDSFQFSNHNIKISNGDYAIGGVIPNAKDGIAFQYLRTKSSFLSSGSNETFEQYIQAAKDKGYCFAFIRVLLETQQGEQQVVRYISPYDAHNFKNGDNANFVETLGSLLTYPDNRAKEMEVAVILFNGNVYRRSATFQLTAHPYLNIAYYIDPELKPIILPNIGSSYGVPLEQFLAGVDSNLFTIPTERNNIEDFPNGMKISAANNPLFFPYETTYQVGSSEIVALMSNAVAVGTGQTGAAPLYVFCKDGIYSLMVDSSGEMTYANARIIARDVCNNAKSVTPIDSGVVFTTDRGLMSIAGSEVVEIGSAAEGDVFDITDNGNLPTNPAMADKAKKIMFNAFTMPQLAEFPEGLIGNTDFLTYLKGAIVNYNHNERELMVSNPSKDYTYVMDRNGNWSRRAFTAQEYVNNYPTSYRIDKAGNFYKVDADDNDTNKVYLLSNVIKLGTIAFKQAYRLVVRGYFETEEAKLGLYVFGSYDGRQWSMIGANERDGQFTDIGCKISHTDIKFIRICIAGKISHISRIDFVEISYDGSNLNTKLR